MTGRRTVARRRFLRRPDRIRARCRGRCATAAPGWRRLHVLL